VLPGFAFDQRSIIGEKKSRVRKDTASFRDGKTGDAGYLREILPKPISR